MIDSAESGAHDADVAWNTELTEPDDLELLKITANNPSTHASITQRVNIMGHISSFFTMSSMLGWLILTCSLIDVARTIGLEGWNTTEDNAYGTPVTATGTGFSGTNRMGDPIIAANWYWLTLSLGVTLAVSSYSSFRRNRGIIGGALLLSLMTTLQWMSLFIYAARRAAEQNNNNSQYPISSLYNAKHSQYAEVAGAGVICASELVRSLILFARYMTYMLVTKLDHDRVHVPSHVDAPTVVQAERDAYNPGYAGHYSGTNTINDQDYKTAHQVHHHQPVTEVNVPGPAYDPADGDLYVPSYNMGVFHGASLGFRLAFILQVLTILGWWVMQIVEQSNSGIWNVFGYNPESSLYPTNMNGQPGVSSNPSGFNTFEAPDRSYYYNEYMFLLCTALVLGAWIPAFYAEREASIAAAEAAVYATALMCLGFFLLVWTFAYESIYGFGTLYSSVCTDGGSQWCNMTQASGVFAMISLFCLVVLFIHTVMRLAERRARITVWERSVQNVAAGIAPLAIAAIGIWAFTTLYYGLYTNGVLNQFQSLQGAIVTPAIRPYFATQAFLTFTIVSVAVWFGTYASKLLYAWQSWAWRMISLFTSMLAAAICIPLIIYASRFIYNGSLSNADLTLASAIIILTAGTVFYFAAFSFLIHTAFYAAGPAGAALPPTGMALKANQQFIENKRETGIVRDPAVGAPVGTYTSDTQYASTAEPVVNPRTGETAIAIDQYPAAQQTTVTAPVQQYTTSTATAPYYQPTAQVVGPGNEVRYHDEY
jgi:hypothetical protein